MIAYLLKRLLLAIPTLLVISLLAFGLNQCTPGDPVVAQMPDIRSSSPFETEKLYQLTYRRLSKNLGTDLPLFYFSISSQAYPDTLYRIIPKADRENLSQLIGLYGNWSEIQAYHQQLQKCIQQSLIISDTHSSNPLIKTRTKLQQLSVRSQPKAIETFIDSLQVFLQADSVLNASLGNDISELKNDHNQLKSKATNYKKYIPTFRWHAADNQYHKWLNRLLHGDLGVDKTTGQSVIVVIKQALRWTIQLNGVAVFLAFLLSIPLGVYAARWADSRFDRILSVLLVLLYAMPSFWVATMLSKFLTVPEWIGLFPVMGVGDLPPDASLWETLKVRSHHLFLPIFCMTYASLAFITRQVRNSMIEVLKSDYVRTARAKGLSEKTVIWKHAFRNAMFPIITMFASILPAIVAGSIIIERIFNIPGIGWLTIESIYTKNWPIVYALLLMTAVLTIIGILLSDLLYALADPRVKLSNKD